MTNFTLIINGVRFKDCSRQSAQGWIMYAIERGGIWQLEWATTPNEPQTDTKTVDNK